MDEQDIRAAIDRHWASSAAGDQDAEHEIYHDDAVCEYPQSGEVIRGRHNLQALRSHHPGRPSGFAVTPSTGGAGTGPYGPGLVCSAGRAMCISMS